VLEERIKQDESCGKQGDARDEEECKQTKMKPWSGADVVMMRSPPGFLPQRNLIRIAQLAITSDPKGNFFGWKARGRSILLLYKSLLNFIQEKSQERQGKPMEKQVAIFDMSSLRHR
jgi:hypothetical protein